MIGIGSGVLLLHACVATGVDASHDRLREAYGPIAMNRVALEPVAFHASWFEETPDAPATPATPATPDADTDTLEDAPASRPRYGTRGSSRWTLQFAGGVEVSSASNPIVFGGAGWSYFVWNGFSLDVELNALYADQTGPDATGINANLLLRWHFVEQPTWSLYMEGGCGLLYTNNDLPAEGSRFNFTPQIGVGMTVDVGHDVRLMLGARIHHISNAGLFDENVGRNSVVGVIGLSFPIGR